jgi:hypothetical protein
VEPDETPNGKFPCQVLVPAFAVSVMVTAYVPDPGKDSSPSETLNEPLVVCANTPDWGLPSVLVRTTTLEFAKVTRAVYCDALPARTYQWR